MFTNDCQKCGKEFLVTDEDLELFTTQNVPIPTLCEECRAGNSENVEANEVETQPTMILEEKEEDDNSFYKVVDVDEDGNNIEEAPVIDLTDVAEEPVIDVTAPYEETPVIDVTAPLEETPAFTTPVEEPVAPYMQEPTMPAEVAAPVMPAEVIAPVMAEPLADTQNVIQEVPAEVKAKKPISKKSIAILAVLCVVLLAAVAFAILMATGIIDLDGSDSKSSKKSNSKDVVTEATTEANIEIVIDGEETTEEVTEEITEEVTEATTEEITEEITEDITEETTDAITNTTHERNTTPNNAYVGDGFTLIYS